MIADALRAASALPVGSSGCFVVSFGSALRVQGDIDRRFALASITKLFTSYAALVAIEEGTIALSDPAGPEHSTVAHLLAHASGLSQDDPTVVRAPPGTRRIYSNAGIEVLAGVIAERAAMSFPDYLAESVLEPLDLRSATLEGSPARGLSCSVADLARFAAELLSPSLIAEATLKQARSVQFPGLSGVVPGFGHYANCDWGLGFELKDHKSPHWTAPENSPGTFGHFGQAGGFLWVDPVAEVSLGLLSDRPFGDWAAQSWPAIGSALFGPTTGA